MRPLSRLDRCGSHCTLSRFTLLANALAAKSQKTSISEVSVCQVRVPCPRKTRHLSLPGCVRRMNALNAESQRSISTAMTDSEREISSLVLAVHRRNQGRLIALDLRWRLLEPALGLDSLDLAEIVAAIERRFAVSLFDAGQAPATWADVARAVGTSGRKGAVPTSPSLGVSENL